jgi:hypothetical protein
MGDDGSVCDSSYSCDGYWESAASDTSNCCVGSCTYICSWDTNGDPVYPGGTSYWSDGYDEYDSSCNITSYYYETTTTTSDGYDGSIQCGFDAYNVPVYSGNIGCYIDGDGIAFGVEFDSDCNESANFYDESLCSSDATYDSSDYTADSCGTGCYWDTDHCECESGTCPDTCSWVKDGAYCTCPWDSDYLYATEDDTDTEEDEEEDEEEEDEEEEEEDEKDTYTYFTDEDMCVQDYYGARIYPWGLAYNQDGTWDQYDENCEVVDSGEQFDDWSTFNWANPDMVDYVDEYKDEFEDKYDVWVQYGFEDDNHYEYNEWDKWGDYDDDWNDTIDSRDVTNKTNDFHGMLNNYSFDHEWSRLANRQDNLVYHFDNMISNRQREMSMYGSNDGMEDSIDGLTELSESAKELITELEVIEELYFDDKSELESSVNNMNGSSWGEVAITELKILKMDGYSGLADAMDARVTWVENMESVADVQNQIGMVYQTYEKAGMDVPSKVEKDLDSVWVQINNLVDYESDLEEAYDDVKDKVSEMRSLTEYNDILDASDDVWVQISDLHKVKNDMFDDFDDFWKDDVWVQIDDAMRGAHGAQQAQDLTREVTTIRSEIAQAESFVSVLKKMDIDKSSVEKAVYELESLTGNGLDALDKMSDFLDEGDYLDDPDKIFEFWNTMDTLGYAAETYMNKAFNWLETNPDEISKLSSSDQDIIGDMMDADFGKDDDYDNYDDYYDNYDFDEFRGYDNHGYYDDHDAFDKSRFAMAEAYTGLVFTEGLNFDELVASITADVVEQVTRKLTANVMEKIAMHYDGKAGDMLGRALNLTDVWVQIDDVLESTTEVLDAMLADEVWVQVADTVGDDVWVQISDEVEVLEELQEETQNTVIATDVAPDMEDVWVQIGVDLEVGDVTEEDLQDYVDEVQDLLAENEDSLVENGFQFYDMTFKDADDLWYYDDVIGARSAGIVNGDPEGTFRPGDNVNMAEALKMVYEAAGENGAAGTPENGAAHGQWFEDYVKQAENDGLPFVSDVSDWGAPANRREIAVWTANVFDLDGEYEDTFPDVNASDQYADHYQAVYEHDIFTGDDGTGYLRPDDNINRAETAKALNFAAENAGALNELDDVLEELSDELVSYGNNSEVFMAAEAKGVLSFLKNLFSSVTSF